MIIKKIHIDGFGHFHDLHLGEFSKGLYLVYGKNEAGKSTIMDFIRMTLFGYERLHEDRRPPLVGGNHGGLISLEDSHGKKWEIYRSGSGRRDNYALINAASGERVENDLRYKNIISHASAELFNNIYAIGLKELFSFESIGESGMKDQIYSLGLGLGSMNIGDFEKGLITNAEEWYKFRASTKTSNELLKELEELESRLHGSSKIVEDYDQLHFQLKEKQELRNQLQSQSSELNRTKNKIQSLHRSYPDYITYKESSEKLLALKELKEIPNTLIQKERDLGNSRINSEKEVSELESELAELKFKFEQIKVDSALLDHPDKLEFLRTRTELLSNLLDSQSELESSIARSEKLIADTLGEMGQAYRLDLVLNFRSTMELESEAKRYNEFLRDQDHEINRLRIIRDERIADHRRKEQQFSNQKENILASGQTLEQLKRELAEVEADFALALKENSGQKALPIIGKFALLLLSLILAVTGVLLWNELTMLAIISLIFGLLGLIVFFLIYFGPVAAGNNKKDLSELQFRISELKEKINELSQDIKNAEHLGKEIADLSAEIESLEIALGNVDKRKKEASLKWDDFTTELGLAKGIDSFSVDRLISNIRRINELHATQEEDQKKLKRTNEEIEQFKELVSLFNPQPIEHKNLLGLANELRKTLETAFDLKGKRDQLHQEILRSEKRKKTANNRLEQTNQELADIYLGLGVKDRGQFLELLESTESKKNLLTKRDAARAVILTHCGWGELENTIADLDNTDPQSLSEQLDSLDRQSKELEEQIKILSEETGGLRTEMEALEHSADKSGLELKLEEKRTEFNEGYQQWLEHKLAAALVSICRKRYEETRQPGVIQNTKRIFSAITKGRYDNIIIDIHGDMEILEDKGPRKSIDNLSRGTREQLLLSLRMGLIEEYEQGAEPLPVILDDVLVNFDHPRTLQTAEQLMEFAKGRQVIFFSCHRHMKSLFESLGAKILEV